MSGVVEPGYTDEKWAAGTGKWNKCTRDENRELLECYYTCNPRVTGVRVEGQ